MKERILEFIKNNVNSDGLDIVIGLKADVEVVYAFLDILMEANIITKHYYGISTYYTVN